MYGTYWCQLRDLSHTADSTRHNSANKEQTRKIKSISFDREALPDKKCYAFFIAMPAIPAEIASHAVSGRERHDPGF